MFPWTVDKLGFLVRVTVIKQLSQKISSCIRPSGSELKASGLTRLTADMLEEPYVLYIYLYGRNVVLGISCSVSVTKYVCARACSTELVYEHER